MGVNLEARLSKPTYGAAGRRDIVPAVVELQDSIGEALNSDLDLGGAEPTEPYRLFEAQVVGPRLDCQPHAARCSRLVSSLRGLERLPVASFRGVQPAAAELCRQEIPHHGVVAACQSLPVDALGLTLGFSSVASGPLVRSSYHAESTYDDMENRSDVPVR